MESSPRNLPTATIGGAKTSPSRQYKNTPKNAQGNIQHINDRDVENKKMPPRKAHHRRRTERKELRKTKELIPKEQKTGKTKTDHIWPGAKDADQDGN